MSGRALRAKAPALGANGIAAAAAAAGTPATPATAASSALPVPVPSIPSSIHATPATTTANIPTPATVTQNATALASAAAAMAGVPVSASVSSFHSPAFIMPTPSSPMLVHAIRLAPGADLHGSLMEFLRVHRPEAATILSAVGSLTNANIRFANVPDDQVKPQPTGHYEIVSLVGTLSLNGGNHIHISISDAKGTTIGGHLMPSGNLVYTTVELVVGVLPSLIFKRETDPTFGYKELVVYPANKMGPLSFLGTDMTVPFMTAPMPPMTSIPASLKRKAEDEKPAAIGSALKKQKNVNAKAVKKEPAEEKDDKKKINPSALTLANMPLVLPGSSPLASPGSGSPAGPSATSPTSADSQKKPQAQLWTPAQFSVFLKSLKLDHLVPIFQWNKVDAKQFLELKLTDIRDRLGIRDPADVANVLNCINILRGSTSTGSTSPESAAAAPKASAPLSAASTVPVNKAK